MANNLNRVENAVNMRIPVHNIKNIIDKCYIFLGNLKTSPTTRTSSQINREFGNELKVIRSNIGSIVDN